MFLCRRVIKLELESSVKKSTAEALDWKKKYENEVFVHKENLDTLKKNTAKQVLGLEDTINQLNLNEEDRVFIISGSAHASFLKDVMQRSVKYQLVNTLDFLDVENVLKL